MQQPRLFPESYAQDIEETHSKAKPLRYPIFEQINDDVTIIENELLKTESTHFNSQHYHGNHHNYILKQAEFPDYPAAKIILESRPGEFDVLSKGPENLEQFEKLLASLKTAGVRSIIAVGLPVEKEKFKYFDYMLRAREISYRDFFVHTSGSQNAIPNLSATTIKFYHYVSTAHGEFFVMHIREWPDHAIPNFKLADKQVLGFHFASGNPSCFHCSAGIGRSVCLMMSKMAYRSLFMENRYLNLDLVRIRAEFGNIVRRVKTIKPVAGSDGYQILAVLGLAEDFHLLTKPQAQPQPQPQSLISTSKDPKLFGNTLSSSVPLAKEVKVATPRPNQIPSESSGGCRPF